MTIAAARPFVMAVSGPSLAPTDNTRLRPRPILS
jgi:hypothetical protein